MRFIVTRKEIWDTYVEVEANSPEHARHKVAYGYGDVKESEHSRTLDPDTWNVEEKQDREK